MKQYKTTYGVCSAGHVQDPIKPADNIGVDGVYGAWRMVGSAAISAASIHGKNDVIVTLFWFWERDAPLGR